MALRAAERTLSFLGTIILSIELKQKQIRLETDQNCLYMQEATFAPKKGDVEAARWFFLGMQLFS